VAIAPERSSKCFEFSLCFGNSPNYDAWLRRSIVKRDKKGRNRKVLLMNLRLSLRLRLRMHLSLNVSLNPNVSML